MLVGGNSLKGFADLPDLIFLIPILAGVGYALVVWTVCETPLAEIFPVLPRLFGARVRPLAVATFLFGLGLVLAGAKYHAYDGAAATFYSIAGWFLLGVGVFISMRRST
jgi:hypothetical protein